MTFVLLPDLPPAQIKAILQHLDPQDHANLRQVSHSISDCANQNIPFISLLLTDSSSEEQLYKWDQATQQLQHVPSIHVHIAGKISAEMFDLVMQLLSKRHQVKELHLRPARLCGLGCSIPSLQPLALVASQLTSLAVESVAVNSLSKSTQNLAAAAPKAGWNLNSLVLTPFRNIDDGWLEYVDTIKQLKAVFPKLRNLVISAPIDEFDLKPPGPIKLGVDQQQVQLRSAITSVAALVNAVLLLDSLESLHISRLYDIWVYNAAMRLQAATAASTDKVAAAVLRMGRLNAAVARFNLAASTAEDLGALLHGGPLPSVAAATEAFATLDECGRWLLQQHPKLRQLQIQTNEGWMMSWKHQGQNHPVKLPLSSTAYSSAVDSSAVAPPAGNVSWSVDVAQFRCESAAYKADWSIVSQGPFTNPWSQYVFHHLSFYSSVPAPDLLRHIISCSLGLIHNEVESLVEVLRDLTSLKELKVALLTDMHRISGPDISLWRSRVAATAAAAAQVPALEVFHFEIPNAVLSGVYAPEDLLLPLTAAAGGPGSNLKKLRLVADFHKGMPAAQLPASEPLEWSVSDRGTSSRPAMSTLIQRIKDLHIATTALSESSITSLVQYGWSSTFDRLTHAADGITHWQATAAAEDSSASVLDDSSSTIEVEGKNSSMLGRLWRRLSALVAGREFDLWQKQQHQQQQPNTTAKLHAMLYRQKLAAAALCLGSGWHQALQQLDGLQELHLEDDATYGHTDVLVDCLPAGLKVLRGKRLRITSLDTVAADAPAASGSTQPDGTASETVLIVSPASKGPQLHELSLFICQLSSPGVLASAQLTKLTVDEVQWSGGWAAAGAAWPNVRELRWHQYHYDTVLSTMMTFHAINNTSAVEDTFDGPALLQGISAAFKQLRLLQVAKLPEECFSLQVLQPVVARLSNIQHLDIRISYSRGRNSTNTEHVSEVEAVQQWLHQQLPYAFIK